MLGRSLPEYVFIRLSIFALQLITPLSIAYMCASWYYKHALYSPWIAIYAGLEASFYLLVFVPRNRLLQKAATHPPLPSREEREALFAKCFAQLRDETYATGWFYFVDSKLIRRENLLDWLSWAFFGTHPDGLHEEWAEEIEGYLRNIEQLLGHKTEDGRDHTVRAIKVSLDPVVTAYRPLLWYLIGLWPYVPFLQELADADPDVGILATECLAISMHISAPPLSRPEMLAALTALLDVHSVSRVVVAAHSYGTVHAAHMLRDPTLSARVSAWLFIDPIPFLLHQPSVAYNFVYRQPRTANEWQLWYFASRDPDIARTLARHFFWAENILWKEDIEGRNVAVVLSELDQIVDAKEVRQYLTDEVTDEPKFRWQKEGLEVLWYRGIDHAQVFDTKTRRRPLISILQSFAERKRSLD
ncbi:hypothetical protein BD311DRAFT_734645 [Dichomitus squalens]|uniref:AB hydrolase-1 domain-containing protein n=1 Tax=Dichomitus squalens TaxID=114155 RepID=A0A4Q9N435_9APHY|nr:hypothetical protein BD311DRAFT_734645 [Dichomitus squalens]